MAARVAVVGANGRMGRLVTRIIEAAEDLETHALIGSGDSLDAIAGADVVVDVTVSHVSQGVVERAIAERIPIVVGTSGWSRDRVAALAPLLGEEPASAVLVIPNFSIGSVLATSFAALASRYFDSIEIVEAHHAGKVDSPSGTAVRTAELIGEARSGIGPVAAPHIDQRARGEQVWSIPIHSLRMAGVVAKQDVLFGGTGETLTISHETLSSDAYEAGILVAVRAAPTVRGIVVGLDKLIDLRT
ncbi:4-hydroxy-tetrahydrodipicolinate reductase [Galbitalea sp. SE-J8]|uniref:4-hydroxy-tetrahydrodipicolinate reductase n=1 Tax=Galbitalea sp. SE-J8 TaxID=3054952 RepID=UPI00338E9E34